MNLRQILKLAVLLGLLLGIALYFFLPEKAISEETCKIEVKIIREVTPDTIKKYAKEKVTQEWDESQWEYFYKIIDSESSWLVNKEHYPKP